MSIRYPEEVTTESQTKKATERIALYQWQLDTINQILPIVEKFEGKKITKHIETAIKKAFPDLRGWLSTEYGMYQFKVRPSNDKEMSIFLGHQNTTASMVNMEHIRESNRCYTLSEERIPKLKAGLPHIAKMVSKRNKAIEMFQDLVKEAEGYEMDYDFDLGK